MVYIVTMSSEEYGSEDFEYDTLKEAKEGLKRLEKEAERLNDGIKRTFTISKEIE